MTIAIVILIITVVLISWAVQKNFNDIKDVERRVNDLEQHSKP